MQPFGQNPDYHDFADRRAFFGIPNFFDVMSNIPFLLVGMAGMSFCFGNRLVSFRPAWLTFFAGVAIVSVGSGYYHWNPTNETLVWDRLPMTIGFMGLFVAVLAEYVSARLGRFLLVPALLMGLSSVFYWHWFDDFAILCVDSVYPATDSSGCNGAASDRGTPTNGCSWWLLRVIC